MFLIRVKNFKNEEKSFRILSATIKTAIYIKGHPKCALTLGEQKLRRPARFSFDPGVPLS